MKEKIEAYLAAKAAEQDANKLRLEAEKALIEQRISRKLDKKAYALIVDSIPKSVRPVEFVETLKVDDRGCRWLAQNEPGLWQLLSTAITEKPMKIGVKVVEA